MMQFGYELPRDATEKDFNQAIDDILALFLPSCYVRYIEVFDMLDGALRRRFDILDKEMYVQPDRKIWQMQVSEIGKMKKGTDE